MKNKNFYLSIEKKLIIEIIGLYQAIAYVVKILNNLKACILK